MEQELLWCQDCNKNVSEDGCPVHGPMRLIKDSLVPPRALLTAPSVIHIRRLEPAADGRSVHGAFASVNISPRSVFGPLQAPLLSVPLGLSPDQFLLKKFRNGVETGYLDVTDEKCCNWLIYVRPAGHYAEQNCVAYQYRDEIYFATTRLITARTELKVWYAREYAALMGVNVHSKDVSVIRPTSPLSTRLRNSSDCDLVVKVENDSITFPRPLQQRHLSHSLSPVPVYTPVKQEFSTNEPSVPVFHGGNMDSEDFSSPLNDSAERSSRRKGSKPQRVPQSNNKIDNGTNDLSQEAAELSGDVVVEQPLSPHLSLSLPMPMSVSMDSIQNSSTPTPVVAPNDILLIYDNSSNGIQGGSLLLVAPGQCTTPALPNDNLDNWRNASNPPSTLTFVTHSAARNSILVSSSEESMISSENIKSPSSPSLNSEDESNLEQRLLQSSGAASGGGGRPYACSYPECGKLFSSKYKLLRHELIHSQEKRHHCPLCHKKFHRKDHLNNHLKVHERSKIRLECVLCGCIFAKKWTYEKHLALHERDQALSPNARHRLMLAQATRAQEDRDANEDDNDDEQDRHQLADYLQPKDLSLSSSLGGLGGLDDSSPRGSSQPTTLFLLSTETEQEPVQAQPVPSYVHMLKKVPLNQKPSHPCEVCGKVFSASKDLRRHLQTHLGIKPNLCPYCPKKFTRKDHVRRHISTVHADCLPLGGITRSRAQQHEKAMEILAQ